MSGKYDDIIHLPCPTSVTHPRMAVQERAAQFAPFAALTGYDEAIREMARVTEKRIELDEGEIAILNDKLCRIADAIEQKPMISVTYFQPDSRKAGGEYVTATGRIKRIDVYKRMIVMVDGIKIYFEQITDIQAEDLF